MHYRTLVLVPGQGDVDALVSEAMAPYDENRPVELVTEDGDTFWHNPHSFWDGWQIGGRYTGLFSGYDPQQDPGLVEVCFVCSGTGVRDDEIGRAARAENPDYRCNGCDGSGERQMWPTEWPRRDDDVMPAAVAVAALRADDRLRPFTFVVHGGEDASHLEDDGSSTDLDRPGAMVHLIASTVAARLAAGFADDRIVVVDYHS